MVYCGDYSLVPPLNDGCSLAGTSTSLHSDISFIVLENSFFFDPFFRHLFWLIYVGYPSSNWLRYYLAFLL